MAVTGNSGWGDTTLTVRARSEDNDALGVVFRYRDPQNFYRFSMDSQRTYRRLTRTVNGVTSVLREDTVPYESIYLSAAHSPTRRAPGDLRAVCSAYGPKTETTLLRRLSGGRNTASRGGTS